jgi:hypothetical protein
VTLGPAEVHALQHLGPVGGLGAAGARADGQDGVLGVVLAGEEQQGALPGKLRAERVRLAGDVGLGVRVRAVGEEPKQLLEVVRALLEGAPELDLVAQSLGLADDLLRGALVVPEAGFDGAGVERLDAQLLGG